MKVINKSGQQITIRSKSIDIIFPIGVSEQPDSPAVRKYLSLYPGIVSVYTEDQKPELKPVEEKKEVKKKIKESSKKHNKPIENNNSNKEADNVINSDEL